MPKPVSWLPRLAEIRRSVEGSVRTHWSRSELEDLFLMQPRAAGKLLKLLPRVPAAGNAHMVGRDDLLRYLDEVRSAPSVTDVNDRRRRQVNRVSRRRPRVLVRKELVDGGLIALPAHVTLERGRLVVTFDTGVELFEGMASIAGCYIADPEAFLEAYEPAQQATEAQLKAAEERRELEALFAGLRALQEAAHAPPTQPSHLPAAIEPPPLPFTLQLDTKP